MASWYYNSDSGKIQQSSWATLGGLEAHLGLGWHGPFASEADAENYYNTNKAKNPGWKTPTTSTAQALATGITSPVSSALGLNISDDEIRSWLLRIGEILLGIVLVGVGIAKVTGTTNAVANIVKARV